ncbi:GroES-like protein [Ganoderma leucocontextum]|nr:GroES-like protein [Ganoderma leucocontextum]
MSALPSRQTAFFLESKFGNFAVRTTDVGQPGPGQLLIKVEAAALNLIDWKVQAHNALDLVETYPSVQGWDLSGTVVAVGEGISAFVVGDRVVSQARYDPTQRALYGTFIQYFIADATFVAKIPAIIAFEEAATVLAGLASASLPLYNQDEAASSAKLIPPWLEDGRQRYAGKPIFILGGATSVGQYVLQLAHLSGFSPIVTSASLQNSELLRSLGATHVLDRTLPADTLQAETTRIAGGAFELVYDAVSLPETLGLTYALTAPRGDLVIVLPAKEIQEAAAKDSDMKRVHVVLGVMSVPLNVDASRSLLDNLPELLESGKIKPNRVEVIPGGLDGIVGGLERLQNDQVHAVKLVVRPHDTS